MAWFALLLAGLLEIGWTLGLKYSAGFTRFWPSVATLVAIIASFGLLGLSLKSVPFGTSVASRMTDMTLHLLRDALDSFADDRPKADATSVMMIKLSANH